MCDVDGTEASTIWQINGSPVVSLSDLSNGTVAGHSVSGRNIVIEDIMMNDVRNGSQYQCVSLAPPITAGNLITLYVAGECNDCNVLVQSISPSSQLNNRLFPKFRLLIRINCQTFDYCLVIVSLIN